MGLLYATINNNYFRRSILRTKDVLFAPGPSRANVRGTHWSRAYKDRWRAHDTPSVHVRCTSTMYYYVLVRCTMYKVRVLCTMYIVQGTSTRYIYLYISPTMLYSSSLQVLRYIVHVYMYIPVVGL